MNLGIASDEILTDDWRDEIPETGRIEDMQEGLSSSFYLILSTRWVGSRGPVNGLGLSRVKKFLFESSPLGTGSKLCLSLALVSRVDRYLSDCNSIPERRKKYCWEVDTTYTVTILFLLITPLITIPI